MLIFQGVLSSLRYINPKKVIGHPQSLSDNMMPREKGAVFVFGGILFGFMLKDTFPFLPKVLLRFLNSLLPQRLTTIPWKSMVGRHFFLLKLLMQRILHQLICSLSRYSHWFCASQVVIAGFLNHQQKMVCLLEESSITLPWKIRTLWQESGRS